MLFLGFSFGGSSFFVTRNVACQTCSCSSLAGARTLTTNSNFSLVVDLVKWVVKFHSIFTPKSFTPRLYLSSSLQVTMMHRKSGTLDTYGNDNNIDNSKTKQRDLPKE